MRRRELIVTEELCGIKVDTLLRSRMGLSGTVIRRIKWLDDGILVDGQRVSTRFVPEVGQVLSARLSEAERRSGIVSTAGELHIVYEDDDVIVLNKQANITIHPSSGHFDDTIGNYLLHYYDVTHKEGDFHPVHRLDRGTTGLMVVACHPHAQEVLTQQLHSDSFSRHYQAICCGVPTPAKGWIDAPLGRTDDSIIKRQVQEGGQHARTWYETMEQVGENTLVHLALETGRTHQIRVHMAHIGHPLRGDFLYGIEEQDIITRPALHSAELRFLHPITGEKMEFICPMPEDMRRLLDK